MTTRIALVGDRSPHVAAHGRIHEIMGRLTDVDAFWLDSTEIDAAEIAAFDGVWAVPGSPYVEEAGVITAIRTAREQAIPFLGTCGGFQHAMLEYARDVAGLPAAWHAENRDAAIDDSALLVPLACSLVGHENDVALVPDTVAARTVGRLRTRERFHCSFGLAPGAGERLEGAGLMISGRDPAGDVRICELPAHPYFVGTLFQPELADEQPHPLVRGFFDAAGARAQARRPIPV
ncbi:MAG: hypothetical protein J7513_03655 [Solirubrobacteraceae bacterium]|nr:hypothetical protein [Solirubrobacteraceae bacterium]